ASGITNIVIQGSDDNDVFANDGDDVSGIVFYALNGSNTLINTGSNVSGVEYYGGDADDRFINSGYALSSSTFYAEAGDDRLINSGTKTQVVRMVGGAGSDWWINQASATDGIQLTLEAGSFDDGADAFINWAANVRSVFVEGGDGDDLLQNGGMNAAEFEFFGGAGNDLLLNLGYGIDQFVFDAGDGNDVFENRGRSGGTLRMRGGSGDDAFYQNAGSAFDVELDGGDGNDTVLNFSSNMTRVALIGGQGTDILQNSGNDVGSLELFGGDGKNTLQNFGHRLDVIRMFGTNLLSSAFDTLLNSGSTVGLIDVNSKALSTVISSGDNIGSISVIGSPFNDVVRVTGRNIQSTAMYGNDGDDSLLIDTLSHVGSAVDFFGGSGEDLLILRGTTDHVLFQGDEDDDQAVFSGTVNSAILRGGDGDDLYRFVGTPTGNITIDEAFIGTPSVMDLSRDTLDFSSYLAGPVILDLAITTPQSQAGEQTVLVLQLTNGMGVENVIGTSGADTIFGNARSNVLSGARFLSSGSFTSGTPVAQTKTQWVYLDFHSNNDAGEYVYSTMDTLDVKGRIEQAYVGFDVRFVLDRDGMPLEIRNDESQYVTIYFNRTPSSGRPGGEASEIDFGNINPGGTGTVQINGMLGGREVLEAGLKAVAAPSEVADGDQIQAPDLPKPASTVENFIALSAKLGAHELAHLLGLRHYDAFGPVGFGVHSPPGLDRFKPTYSGIAAAFETMDHIIGSPASIGSTRFNDLRQLYFGEREAIKLALAFSDQSLVRTDEPATPHNTLLTAQPLTLVTLDVPNLATGGVSKDQFFHVQAASVVGTIGLEGATSESDWYSFDGNAGDIVTIEVMSRALKRYYTSNATSIDSVLRLYNAAGELVQTFGTDAVNDDEFESSDSLLMDVILPEDGQYFIEVDTFRRLPGEISTEDAAALRAELEARHTDTDPDNNLSADELLLLGRLADSLDDTDTGNYELLMYRSTSVSATDGIDNLKGREGIDEIYGGPGDDYGLHLQVSGDSSALEASPWSGSYQIVDRGGDSWTAVIDFGDGTAPITTSPGSATIGSAIPLSHVYADNGNYVVTITVTNDDGHTETQTRAVTITNVDPTASLTGPATGITGTPALFNVAASDVAGAADPLSYSWTITRDGAAYAIQTGGTSHSLNATLPGSYLVTVEVSDGDGGVVVRSRTITISSAVTAAKVASIVIDDGSAQRSMLRSLTITFDQAVSIQPGAFTVQKRGPGGETVSLNTPAITTDASGRTVVRLTFASLVGNSLRDGNYQLRIDSSKVSSSGLALDGDGNGSAGGDRIFGNDPGHKFFRLFGDGNGDRVVNVTDTTMFGTTYQKRVGQPLFNSIFDSDSDGDVDATDYAFMRNQINKTMSFL
ncbi:MAG: pre-peptidase C-terminal domain-containing protein, partial [Planctomyces sp.]|nr:pre-peptidase C-terminal domain-containing protein [Planctomyces sp.]